MLSFKVCDPDNNKQQTQMVKYNLLLSSKFSFHYLTSFYLEFIELKIKKTPFNNFDTQKYIFTRHFLNVLKMVAF